MQEVILSQGNDDIGPNWTTSDGWTWNFDQSGEMCDGGTELEGCLEPAEYSGDNGEAARQLCRGHFRQMSLGWQIRHDNERN